MIRHLLQRLFAIGLLAVALSLGCANEAPPPEGKEGEGEGEGEAVVTCEPGQYCANLQAVEPATVQFSMFQMEERTIRIRYMKPDPENPGRELPIPNSQISWSIEEMGASMPGAGLKAGNTVTNAQGETENVVVAGTGIGDLKVTAYVRSGVAEPLEYTISVTSKTDGIIEVRVEYPHGVFTGDNRFDGVKVYFWEHKNGPVACAGLDPNSLPLGADYTPDVPLPLPNAVQQPYLHTGTHYTVIAVATKSFPDTQPVAVASACDEQSAVAVGGRVERVTLQLTDLIFPYTGRYKAHTFINFLTMLPGDPVNCSIFSGEDCNSIEGYVTMVADFFTNPGQFVLTVLEDVIEQQFSFNVPDGFRDVLAGLLNAIIREALPDWVGDTFTVGEDIATILQELEIIEYFVFTENPDPSDSDAGLMLFPSCNQGQGNCTQREEWTDICFNWQLGTCDGLDPDASNGCGRQCWPLNAFVAPRNGQPIASVQGGFNASVRNLWDLSIDRHSLQLNYGAIIVGVVEKMILPAVFGVNSIEELVFSLIGGEHPQAHKSCLLMNGAPAQNCCESLALKILGESGSSIWRDAAKSICMAGVPLLVDTLIGYLVGQELDTGSYLVIGTADMFEDIPAAEQVPCHLTFGPDRQDNKMKLIKLGDKQENKVCQLRAGLQISDWDIDYAEAYFYAEREADE